MLGSIRSDVPRGRSARVPPIVVLSDRTLVSDVMVAFLRRHRFPQSCAGAGTAGLYRAIARNSGGLALVDLGNEGEDPGEILREARTHRPETTLVAIGTPLQLAAHAAGADGWIELSDRADRISKIAAAVTRRHRGRLSFRTSPRVQRHLRVWQTLTRRQRQVLGLLGCGMDNAKLAAILSLSERAIKAHVSALLDRFKADNRSELAVIAAQARLPAAGQRCPVLA
jgi:DNA-binding NarL/FixJ family response regulator